MYHLCSPKMCQQCAAKMYHLPWGGATPKNLLSSQEIFSEGGNMSNRRNNMDIRELLVHMRAGSSNRQIAKDMSAFHFIWGQARSRRFIAVKARWSAHYKQCSKHLKHTHLRWVDLAFFECFGDINVLQAKNLVSGSVNDCYTGILSVRPGYGKIPPVPLKEV